MAFFFRYAFRSTEKVALQEIGPRFTLKLRSLKKGLPAVYNYGEDPQALALAPEPQLGVDATVDDEQRPSGVNEESTGQLEPPKKKTVPPKQDEFIWQWKVSHNRIHRDVPLYLTISIAGA